MTASFTVKLLLEVLHSHAFTRKVVMKLKG